MNKILQLTKLSATKLNTNQIRFMWMLLTLALFALGAGAPEGGSGWDGG